MEFKDLIASLDDDSYQKLKRSVELGKFPDGRVLSAEQRQLSLQAVIAYEIENDFPEHERTGFVDTGDSACGGFGDEGFKPMKWQ